MVSSKIIENIVLVEEPKLLNNDPYGEGWILVIEPYNPDEDGQLLTPEQYAEK